jgi:hypothetical protein
MTKEIKEDIKKYSKLKTLKESEGGELLIKALNKDIVSVIQELSNNYKKLTIQEFVGLSASLSEKLSILNVLNNSKNNLKLAQEALKELNETE